MRFAFEVWHDHERRDVWRAEVSWQELGIMVGFCAFLFSPFPIYVSRFFAVMAFAWRSSKLENRGESVVVDHWSGHDPASFARLTSSEPMTLAGGNPAVAVHRWGKRLLAERRVIFTTSSQNVQWLARFGYLAQHFEKARRAFVEVPLAVVRAEKPGEVGVVHLFSLWQRGCMPLHEFIQSRVDSPQVGRALHSSMRELARLHRAGFLHGHSHPYNVLVTNRGRGRWIDYTKLAPSTQARAFENEARNTARSLALTVGACLLAREKGVGFFYKEADFESFALRHSDALRRAVPDFDALESSLLESYRRVYVAPEHARRA